MQNNSVFSTSVKFLKGVGSRKADILEKEFGISTYADFLTYYPFKHVDKSKFYSCLQAAQMLNTDIQIRGHIVDAKIVGEGAKSRLIALFSDGISEIELVWFKSLKYWSDYLRKDVIYIVFGRPTAFNHTINISHPEMRIENDDTQKDNIPFLPCYITSEKAKKSGLDSLNISKLCYQVLSEVHQQILENLPTSVLQQLHLMDRRNALINIHFPQNMELNEKAQYRLKFEEVFFMQLFMLRLKRMHKEQSNGYIFPKVGSLFNEFYYHHLPFSLTKAQERVIKEIWADFKSGKQMNRLLQGDVGSGKTITAVMLMLLAIGNGYQTCLMAPTEILAMQHYKSITKVLQNMPVKVELLTGSTKKKDRKLILPAIENGEIQILIGTHALVENSVVFNRLGFVVIDEQHRFGVEQRAKLWRKNIIPPHVLIMTATPIPRTLSMTVYGDLEVSKIDELPAGRKQIITKHLYQNHRQQLTHFLKSEIAKGRQIYVVFPLIKESETMDFRNLMEGYEAFKIDFPEPQYHISCVHGQLPTDEKEQQMQAFVSGQTQIMLATTVIEVGVDVPNASVMVIENAERFGLSQLHQLRGRVGRGAEQSYCLLVTGVKLTDVSKKRIKAMINTTDGFEIANKDLQLRGPGDIAGIKQSGALNFKLLDIANEKDASIIDIAYKQAASILAQDPELSLPQHALLKKYLIKLFKSKTYYKIG
ncbi:MAG: ATP-dependent DNA helicase RecG [Bacteroidales bacterium]|jgi:ATP-dependent DNA helicase RecG|nr:ATP-dependent DNA helicase RecG [Bacteroidales bacterium]